MKLNKYKQQGGGGEIQAGWQVHSTAHQLLLWMQVLLVISSLCWACGWSSQRGPLVSLLLITPLPPPMQPPLLLLLLLLLSAG
jgi:hypothetical protein